MDAALQSAESFSAHVERVAAALEARAAEAGEPATASRDNVRAVLRTFAEQAPEVTDGSVGSPSRAESRDNRQPTTNDVSEPPPTPVPVTSSTTQTIEVLPEYLRAEGADSGVQGEVEALVSEAFQHGLFSALALAKSKRPIVEDAFHDALVDIVMPILKERKRL